MININLNQCLVIYWCDDTIEWLNGLMLNLKHVEVLLLAGVNLSKILGDTGISIAKRLSSYLSSAISLTNNGGGS